MMRRGVILIPTFRRPEGLAKALAHLALLDTRADVTVLVAENDPAGGQGREVVRRLGPHHRFKLSCIEVIEPGVSHVRNALFTAALAMPGMEFVACMDDDEWPAPQWLQALLEMQQRTNADIVGGTLQPAFAAKAPVWAETFELYRQVQPDGSSTMVWGTCNALLTRAIVEKTGPVWFDPALGLTGGEDMEFFARANAMGASFAWAGSALMHEDVPEKRLSAGWISRRAFRIGSTNTLAELRWRHRRLGYPIMVTKAMARLALAAATVLGKPDDPGRRMKALAQASQAFGEMSGLFGLGYREYGAARSGQTAPRAGDTLVSRTMP
jgi:succinoglycan biosynthesis protein ExoM